MAHAQSVAYPGPERRRHKVFVTRNTEYHFRGSLCIAVKDRRSGSWLPSHLAVNRRLTGGVRFQPDGHAVPYPAEPRLGEALFFANGGRELVTSVLCAVERPEKATVAAYAALSC